MKLLLARHGQADALWRLRVDNPSRTTVAPPRLLSINDTTHLSP